MAVLLQITSYLTLPVLVVDPADVAYYDCFSGSSLVEKSHCNFTWRPKWGVLVFTAVNVGQSDGVSLTG